MSSLIPVYLMALSPSGDISLALRKGLPAAQKRTHVNVLYFPFHAL